MMLIRNGTPPANLFCDVLVYGFTPGGVTAACAAARQGLSVVLLGGWRDTLNNLGGMLANGLSKTDINKFASVGGLSLEFFTRVWAHYGVEPETTFDFEPHVAHQIFLDMLNDFGVQVVASRGIVSRAKDGTRLLRIGTLDGLSVAARAFVCSSYEGDLMRQAGANLVTGREGNAQFGETLNGIIMPADLSHNYGGYYTDPWWTPGDTTSGLLPGINVISGTNGAADNGTQAYNFRLCMTQNTANQLPLPTSPPAGFEPMRYEPFIRYLVARRAAGRVDKTENVVTIDAIQDTGKSDWNARGAFSTDDFGGSWRYVAAQSFGQREAAWKDTEAFIRGFLWVLWGHRDGRIPQYLRDAARTWSFAADEFAAPNFGDQRGWPRQLYIREFARLRSPLILTQQDVERADTEPVPYADEIVALASYFADSHNVQRYATLGPSGWRTQNEGGFFENVGGRNAITPVPFGCLIPRAADSANTITTWSVGATHVCYSLLRMEPTHMCIGHAAGLAAAMMVEHDLANFEVLRNTPSLIDELRAMLRAEGAAIDYV